MCRLLLATVIDLRSDTVTKPSPGMRAAMAAAEVGDDVFREDPTVRSLEERLADIFGHEAGLFCPSGTMTNQIAVNVHTRPGDEVICDEGAHIYRYEGGGVMANSGCSVKLLTSDHGRFTAEQVEAAINIPAADWLARTRLVNIENTSNRGGGTVWDLAEVERIRLICRKHGMAMHLDGARIFNALAVTGGSPRQWGTFFDTISICLSKGLGAPVGSVLVGPKDVMHQARRIRKRFGGGMRQSGILAAACHYALDHNVERLKEDHDRAHRLAEALRPLPFVEGIMPGRTNIVVFSVRKDVPVTELLARWEQQGVRAIAFGATQVRMVTHLDIDDTAMDHILNTIERTAHAFA